MTGHKDLPWPTLQQVADADAGSPPSAEVEAAIVAAAATTKQNNGVPADGVLDDLDAYVIHADVHQNHPGVTIGQVARVLLERGLAS